MDEYWKIGSYSKEEEKFSLTNWIKKHWENIALNVIIWSLLIISICSIIQLIITLRK
jgi:hypothetical protein